MQHVYQLKCMCSLKQLARLVTMGGFIKEKKRKTFEINIFQINLFQKVVAAFGPIKCFNSYKATSVVCFLQKPRGRNQHVLPRVRSILPIMNCKRITRTFTQNDQKLC